MAVISNDKWSSQTNLTNYRVTFFYIYMYMYIFLYLPYYTSSDQLIHQIISLIIIFQPVLLLESVLVFPKI